MLYVLLKERGVWLARCEKGLVNFNIEGLSHHLSGRQISSPAIAMLVSWPFCAKNCDGLSVW